MQSGRMRSEPRSSNRIVEANESVVGKTITPNLGGQHRSFWLPVLTVRYFQECGSGLRFRARPKSEHS